MTRTSLDLGDIGLMLAKLHGQLCLFKMGFLSGVFELLGELFVFFGEAGFLNRIKYSLKYPILEYKFIP